jgi:hypothetical protein
MKWTVLASSTKGIQEREATMTFEQVVWRLHGFTSGKSIATLLIVEQYYWCIPSTFTVHVRREPIMRVPCPIIKAGGKRITKAFIVKRFPARKSFARPRL